MTGLIGKRMAFFLIEATYNSNALAAMANNPQDRVAPVRAMVERAGGTLHHFFYALGDIDLVAIVELPDAEAASAVAFTVAKAGHMSTYRTRLLLTAEQGVDAMKKAHDLSLPAPK